MTFDVWTLLFQGVNVAVLVWLLGRFFWRPVAATIEARREHARRMIDEAEATRAEAAIALAEIQRARAEVARERDAILAAARGEADAARIASQAAVAREAAVWRAAAESRTEQERAAAERAWSERASRFSLEIARRLAARLDGSAVYEAFLDWLDAEIRRLPESTRLAMASDDAVVEIISATALPEADEERVRARISQAVGGHPTFSFRIDPDLIAGLELRGPHLIVSNSWRADLTRIMGDLAHEHAS